MDGEQYSRQEAASVLVEEHLQSLVRGVQAESPTPSRCSTASASPNSFAGSRRLVLVPALLALVLVASWASPPSRWRLGRDEASGMPFPSKVSEFDSAAIAALAAPDCLVVLFQEPWLSGSHISLPPGDYDGVALGLAGVPNGTVRSLEVKGDCTAIMYNHSDFTGWSAFLPTGAHLQQELWDRGVVGETVGALRVVAGQVRPGPEAAMLPLQRVAADGLPRPAEMPVRIGVVLPWLHNPMPYCIDVLCKSAVPSAGLLDLLIVTEEHWYHDLPWSCQEAPNVKHIVLEEGGLARRVVWAAVGRDDPALHEGVSHLLSTNPGATVMYKPMFGAMFEEFLTNYTHWGYGDGDMVYGNLQGLVAADAMHYDIVTYTFEGDTPSLFLRGQATYYKKSDATKELYRFCRHLNDNLTATFSGWYSGEACISQAAMEAKGVTIKFTPQMFNDAQAWPPILWRNGRLCRGSLQACMAGFNAKPPEHGLCSATHDVERATRIEVVVGSREGCQQTCTSRNLTERCIWWTQEFATCAAESSLDGWGAFDAVVKEADGTVWRIPGTVQPCTALGADPPMEAAFWHFRVWQDDWKDVRIDTKIPGMIIFSTGAHESIQF